MENAGVKSEICAAVRCTPCTHFSSNSCLPAASKVAQSTSLGPLTVRFFPEVQRSGSSVSRNKPICTCGRKMAFPGPVAAHRAAWLRKSITTSNSPFFRLQSTQSTMSTALRNINPTFHSVQYAVRGELAIKAEKLRDDLKQPDHGHPFDKVINSNIGNPQQKGLDQAPITFTRQVCSLLRGIFQHDSLPIRWLR